MLALAPWDLEVVTQDSWVKTRISARADFLNTSAGISPRVEEVTNRRKCISLAESVGMRRMSAWP